MSDKTFLGSNSVDFDTGKSLMPVSRVNIIVDSENYYTAGDDTGRTIEKTCPWGSQEMADSVLAALQGRTYVPYTAKTAIIDPAVEIGDGITSGGVYSVIANKNISFDSLLTADVSAPGSDEIDDEYPYISKSERQSKLKEAQTHSYIDKTADEIKLGVKNDMDGRFAELDITLDGITSTVKGLGESLSVVEQTAESITSAVYDEDGFVHSLVKQTADEISSTVEAVDGRVSSLKQTVDSLTVELRDAQGNISSLQRTATSVTDKLEDIDGNINTLTRTATSLESSITSANGEISTLKQDAKTLESSIKSANGEISTLKQTATGLTSTVGTLTGTGEGSISSMIKQEIDKIELSVTGSLGGKASITLSGGGGGSGTIDLSGVRRAFANDNSNITISAGTVTFNTGKFISTGTNFKVNAEGILTAKKAVIEQLEVDKKDLGYAFPYSIGNDTSMVVKGDIDLLPHEPLVDYSGTIYGWTRFSSEKLSLVYASHIEGKDWSCLGFNGNVYLRGELIKSTVTINETSDRDLKKDITALDGRHLAFLDAISPISFRYKWQADNAPLSVGYIAQDVEEALGRAGLTRGDFAGLIGTDGEGDMGLGYTQFIPILHLKINDLEKRLKRLEAIA